MKNTHFLFFFIWFFNYFAEALDCLNPKTSQDYLLQSGTFLFIEGVSQLISSQYDISNSCYLIPLEFTPQQNTTYDVLLSTSFFQSNSKINADYSLRSTKNTNSFQIAVISNANYWKKLTVSYLISARTDIFAGSFIVDTLSYFGCNNNETKMPNQIIIQNSRIDAQNFNKNSNFSVSVFISGVQTYPLSGDSNIVNVKVLGQNFNPVKNLLTFNIVSQTIKKFVQIQFHYLLISNSMMLNYELLASTGTGLTQNIFQYPTQYTFSGQISLNSNNDQKNQFTNVNIVDILVNCKGSKCKSICISLNQCLNSGGILNKSTINNQTCLLQCGANEVYNSNNQCQCAYGYKRANNNTNSLCQQIVLKLKCNNNQVINYNTSTCDCISGYVMVRNNCFQSCNVNGVMNGNNCQCLSGYKLAGTDFCHNCTGPGQSANVTTKTCDCYKPTYAKTLAGKCILNPCPGNQTWTQQNNTCSCLNGEIFVNNTVCLPQCVQNGYYLAGCRCLPGYSFINGSCLLILSNCPINQQLDSTRTSCLCNTGFEKIDNATCLPFCGANQIRDTNNVCICKKGFVFTSTSNKTCSILIVNCEVNQVYDQDLNICVCLDGYQRNLSNKCVKSVVVLTPSCGINQLYSNSTNFCVCISGYTHNTATNICELTKINCQQNMILVNQTCKCIPGYILLQTQCVSICGINQEYNTKIDSCQCKTNFGKINNVCQSCPLNAITTSDQPNICMCMRGLILNISTNTCQIKCNQNQQSQKIYFSTDYYYVCYCIDGYQRINETCIKIQQSNNTTNSTCPVSNNISCPVNSTWNAIKYQCVCNSPVQFISNGSCISCSTNEGWNGNQCVCVTGFNRINGKCLKCDSNSAYNQIQGYCTCNYGFYPTSTNVENLTCGKCYELCGQCTNSNQNSCLSCVNISYSLVNGSCIKINSSCNEGFYLSLQNTCQPCSQYCNVCQDTNICTTCVSGFKLQQLNLFGINTTFCPQICGDGKRFEYACDDGNTKNGDGCDSTCNIQSGWTCSGGNSLSPSVCVQVIPSHSYLTVTKPLLLIGQVVQGVTLSYVPDRFTSSSCSQCDNLLIVNVIQTTIVPTIKISYLPTTMYKFLITFDFNGIYAIPLFVFIVQINPQYKDYFTASDMAQTQVIRVDPATLALNDQTQILTLDDSNPFNVFSN